MTKNKEDDFEQALELLEIARDYLVDIVALAILRAETARIHHDSPFGAMRELQAGITDTERTIIAKLGEHFKNGK